jgi:hypothetical protein
MNTRRTASRLATFAALAVASFSGASADAATLTIAGPGNSGVSFVIVLGGKAFAISLTGATQSGGAGSMRLTGATQSGGAG